MPLSKLVERLTISSAIICGEFVFSVGEFLVWRGVDGVGATSLKPASRGERSIPHHGTGEHELSDARVPRCGHDELPTRDVDAAILLFRRRRAASYAMDPRRAVDYRHSHKISDQS